MKENVAVVNIHSNWLSTNCDFWLNSPFCEEIFSCNEGHTSWSRIPIAGSFEESNLSLEKCGVLLVAVLSRAAEMREYQHWY